MKFCSECGSPGSYRIPAGDNRERFVCDDCDTIHYVNPRIVTGCLPFHKDQVLLCKRAIEPRKGWWTLPAGFLENGESIADGARRETLEEANARVRELSLYTVFSLPHISQAYMFYRAQLADLDFSAGEESLAVELVSLDDIPWDELAFPVITSTLKHYIADRRTYELPKEFPVHHEEINFKRR